MKNYFILLLIVLFSITTCTKKTTSPEEQLLPPANLQLTLVEENIVTISWQDNSSDETKFFIDRKKGEYAWFENYGEVEANITAFTDNITTNSDTVYSYKIRAFDGDDYSEYSTEVGWFSEFTVPSDLLLEQIYQDSIRITWSDNSIGELNFRIDKKIGINDWQQNYKILDSDSTTYIDYNPTLFDSCFYRVYAVSGTSFSDYSQNYIIPFLPAPTNFQIEGLEATSIKLTWEDNSADEDGFKIFKSEDDSVWTSTTVPENTEEWIDEDVIPGIINFYKVCAYIDTNYSAFVQDNINTMSQPEDLFLEQLDVTCFQLTWIDNSAFEQGFKIDRKIDNEEWINEISSVGSNITQWIDEDVRRSFEVVYYRVYAFHENYNSAKIESNSNIVFPAPTNLQIEQLTTCEISLIWNDNSDGEEGFKIDRKIGTGNWITNYGNVSANTEEWIDTQPVFNEINYYRVYAFAGNNYSLFVEGEVNNIIPAPSNFVAIQQNVHTFDLSWLDNCDFEEGFEIERKIDNGNWSLIATLPDNTTSFTDDLNMRNRGWETVYYRLYAFFQDNSSDTIETNCNIYFPAPSNLTYQTINLSSIQFNWTYSSYDEDGFKIDKKIGNDDWQIEYGIVTNSSFEWIDENAEINETLKYRVYAFSGENTSDYIETGEIDNSIPIPTNLNGNPLDVSQIYLEWTDNSIEEDGFRIEQKENEGSFVEIGTATQINYTASNLNLDSDYTFRVRAYKDIHNSGYSNECFMNISQNVAPSDLSGIVSIDGIQIQWIDNCSFETGFIIQRKKEGEEYQTIHITDENITDYLNFDIEPLTTYFYRVSAELGIYQSVWCEEINLLSFPDYIIVDLNGNGNYTSIQDAIYGSNDGDSVIVNVGTYYENINYYGKQITLGSLYLLIQDDYYISNTIIDGNANYSVVTFESSEDEDSKLIGFTITNGYASNGGGIYCDNSNPSLSHLIISGNSAGEIAGTHGGGGMYFSYSDPNLENITIIENNSISYAGGIFFSHSNPTIFNVTISNNVAASSGGGIYFFFSSPTLYNVTICDNTAQSGGGIRVYESSPNLNNFTINGNEAESGGGISSGGSFLVLTNSTISENIAGDLGGGIICGEIILNNCIISQNSAEKGGGIYCSGVYSDSELTNVIISGNTAYENGGGIYFSDTEMILTNVTLYENTASNSGGGFYCHSNYTLTIINCIMWNDSPQEIFQFYINNISITYTDIEDGWQGYYNIDSDPLFVDPGNDDFHLLPGSPCIDAGNPTTQYNDPDGSINDMGAYGGPGGVW
ncbi:MAG: hypothetical protein HQ534_03750 [Armatimonadetes bacterium]|nr:hypothetical protein [Armatimonadota bacterium]